MTALFYLIAHLPAALAPAPRASSYPRLAIYLGASVALPAA